MDSSVSHDPRHHAIATFLRNVAGQAIELADELDGTSSRPTQLPIEQTDLGSLQQQVVAAPGMASDSGASPREIAKHLGRGDEPNIRQALNAMRRRGIVELLPGIKPQRWRLTATYRDTPGGPSAG